MLTNAAIDSLSRLRASNVYAAEQGLAFVPVDKVLPSVSMSAKADDRHDVIGYADKLVAKLREAHVFRIEGVPFAPDVADSSIYPGIGVEGGRVFRSGVAKLPFRICMFEFSPRPELVQGLLVEEFGDEIEVNEMSSVGGKEIHFNCYSVLFHRIGSKGDDTSVPDDFPHVSTTVRDPFGHFDRLRAYERTARGTRLTHAEVMDVMMTEPSFAIFLALLLKSNRKSVVASKPRPFANRRLAEKKFAPVPDHHVVTMPPDWSPGPLPGSGMRTGLSGIRSGGLFRYRDPEPRKPTARATPAAKPGLLRRLLGMLGLGGKRNAGIGVGLNLWNARPASRRAPELAHPSAVSISAVESWKWPAAAGPSNGRHPSTMSPASTSTSKPSGRGRWR